MRFDGGNFNLRAIVYLNVPFKKTFLKQSSDDISESTQSNLSAEEWKTLRGLAADKTIIIKRW